MTIAREERLRKKSALIEWLDKKEDDAPLLSRLIRYALRLVVITARQFNRNELALRSGALTYTILLSLVPILALSTAMVKGLGGGDQLREGAYSYIETLENNRVFDLPQLPASENNPPPEVSTDNQELTSHLRSAVDTLFNYVDRTDFATLGTFGVVGILLSVLLVLNHIESAMNAIWDVSAGRPILRKIADYITLLILFPLSINLAFAASAFLNNPLLASKMDIFIPLEWLQPLLLQALPIFFIALSFYALYLFFPNTRVKPLPALIGSLFAAFFWFAIQNIYIALQVGVAKYNAIYGSFATVPLFLVWIYLAWMFVLTGAQLAFALQNATSFPLAPLNGAPSLRLAAAFDVMESIYQDFEAQRATSIDSLVDTLSGYPRHLLRDVTRDLTKAGLIYFSEGDNRLLPLFPRQDFAKERVVQVVLGETVPDSDGGRESMRILGAARKGA